MNGHKTLGREKAFQVYELTVPSDESGQRVRQIGALCTLDALIRRPLRNRTDIPIAAAGQRLDPTIAARRLRQYTADRIDLRREVAFLDDNAWPDRLDDPRLRRKGGSVLDQR